MKNNRGELSARAPGFVIYGIKPGPRPGLDVYLTLLFLPSQTDAIHHVRHLTVQSVLGALDLGYSTRWNLWGLERRLAANSEFSAEGELTVYIITYHIYILYLVYIVHNPLIAIDHITCSPVQSRESVASIIKWNRQSAFSSICTGNGFDME